MYGVVVRPVLMLTLPIHYEYTGYYVPKYAPMCLLVYVKVDLSWVNSIRMLLTIKDYTIMRYADVLLMHSELNGNADGLNQGSPACISLR